jgi:hypothetical protein
MPYVDLSIAEHIYEGFWLKRFFDHIKTTLYADDTCENYAKKILQLDDDTTNGWADKLALHLGNINNNKTTMTLLNGKENRVKHRVGLPHPLSKSRR